MTSATHSRKFTNETDLCWGKARFLQQKSTESLCEIMLSQLRQQQTKDMFTKTDFCRSKARFLQQKSTESLCEIMLSQHHHQSSNTQSSHPTRRTFVGGRLCFYLTEEQGDSGDLIFQSNNIKGLEAKNLHLMELQRGSV